MIDRPQYIIVAGINGAGKSTLYEKDKIGQELFLNTKRINADEISKQHGWDWRKKADNFKAMKIEVKKIHDSIKAKESFHIETTLAGAGKTHLNIINEAKEKGYEVTLLYVGLESDNLAIQRVKQRVEKGGHGISEQDIRKRYVSSLNNLSEVMKHCDNVQIFDNTDKFKLIFKQLNQKVVFDERKNTVWLQKEQTKEKAPARFSLGRLAELKQEREAKEKASPQKEKGKQMEDRER